MFTFYLYIGFNFDLKQIFDASRQQTKAVTTFVPAASCDRTKKLSWDRSASWIPAASVLLNRRDAENYVSSSPEQLNVRGIFLCPFYRMAMPIVVYDKSLKCCDASCKVSAFVIIHCFVTSNEHEWNKQPHSWIKIDQLMSLALFFAQHVSNASTFIFRSLRLCVGILLWFDVCWCYGVVRLGWCGILMQGEALVPQPA